MIRERVCVRLRTFYTRGSCTKNCSVPQDLPPPPPPNSGCSCMFSKSTDDKLQCWCMAALMVEKNGQLSHWLFQIMSSETAIGLTAICSNYSKASQMMFRAFVARQIRKSLPVFNPACHVMDSLWVMKTYIWGLKHFLRYGQETRRESGTSSR